MSHQPNTHPRKEVKILILVCTSWNLLRAHSGKVGERGRPGPTTNHDRWRKPVPQRPRHSALPHRYLGEGKAGLSSSPVHPSTDWVGTYSYIIANLAAEASEISIDLVEVTGKFCNRGSQV